MKAKDQYILKMLSLTFKNIFIVTAQQQPQPQQQNNHKM